MMTLTVLITMENSIFYRCMNFPKTNGVKYVKIGQNWNLQERTSSLMVFEEEGKKTFLIMTTTVGSLFGMGVIQQYS